MNPKSLDEFKTQLLPFYRIFKKVADHYNSGHSNGLTSVEVMLQNLCFDGVGTHQYSHDKEVSKCLNLINILRDIKLLDGSSNFILWACDEATFLWDGLDMTEFMES